MMGMDYDRGTGRTSRQMQTAARGALFVWLNNHIDYPRHLAKKLGRDDLEIVRRGDLYPGHQLRGRTFTEIVIDHAAKLPAREFEAYHQLLAQVRPAAA